MAYITHLNLNPVAPYNFDLSVGIFSWRDPQISEYENGKFWQVIRVNNKLILAIIEATGTIDEPELSIDLNAEEKLQKKDIQSAENTINTIFSLDFDLKKFYKYVASDPVMSKLTRELRGLKSHATSTIFEALTSSIIEQQISLIASRSIERHMIKDHGEKLQIDNKTYYAYPTPESLSKLTREQLRESGLSLRKSEYIIDIAKNITAEKLDLELCKNYDYVSKIVDKLSQLRGVGQWTAHLTVLRSMHLNRAFPTDDLGLRRSVSHFYCDDKKISADDARKIAGRWGKWRGLAGFYVIAGFLRDKKL